MAAETPRALVLLCRPGFERDCAAGIAAHAGAELAFEAVSGAGWLCARESAPGALRRLPASCGFRELVFARDAFTGAAFELGETRDRITPLLALARSGAPVGELWLQHADTTQGRSLGRLGTRIEARLGGALRDAGILRADAEARLHVLFLTGSSGFIGRSLAADGAPWSMGIPRLRLPGAPSRSAAKLEEALLWFGASATERLLREGMSAVDLGAAPGGWSWVLARRGLRVTAVDHGRLAQAALDAGAVRHVSADAFTFRPQRAVDWLVCDVVDKPARVAELIGRWFLEGWCRRSIFNLKLPMHNRQRAAAQILARLQDRLCGVPGGLRCDARQLYHDREEITVFVAPRE